VKAFSFVHTADLHLDSPFKGISEVSEAIGSELTHATFKTFDRIIDLCIERQVSFLLVVGDVYDGADRSLRAQLRFLDGLKRLSDAGIDAYIVHGNHDPLNGWSANLNWPKNVHVYQGQVVGEISVEKDGEEIAQICGISFHKKEITDNLTSKFPQKADLNKDLFTIGMLHCNVGSNAGHEPYAPCSWKDLTLQNYDYWALGHVHTKDVRNNGKPLVIYPGNPQGLNPKEVGPRGCYLVDVDSSGNPSAEFIEVDSVRWFIEELPIGSLQTEHDLILEVNNCIEKIREESDGRPALCRIILTGRGPLYSSIARKGVLNDILEELRASEAGEKQFVWVESFVNDAGPEIDRESMLDREDFIGDLFKLFEETYQGDDKLADLREAIEPLFGSKAGRKLLEPLDDDRLIKLLKRAETVCLDNLMGGEAS